MNGNPSFGCTNICFSLPKKELKIVSFVIYYIHEDLSEDLTLSPTAVQQVKMIIAEAEFKVKVD